MITEAAKTANSKMSLSSGWTASEVARQEHALEHQVILGVQERCGGGAETVPQMGPRRSWGPGAASVAPGAPPRRARPKAPPEKRAALPAPRSSQAPSSPQEQSPFFSGRHTAAVSPLPPTRGAVRERDGHASLRLRPENRRSQPCQASGCRQPLTWHARESTTVLPQRYAQPRSSRRDLPNTGPVYDGTTASPPLAGRNLTNKHHMKDCICSPKP